MNMAMRYLDCRRNRLRHACMVWVGIFPMLLGAQGWTSDHFGIEADVYGGFVVVPNEITGTRSAADPMFRVAQVGVHRDWHIGPFDALGSLFVSMASAFKANDTRPLGMVRLTTHRGPIVLSLGIEQRVGVSVTPTEHIASVPLLDTTPTGHIAPIQLSDTVHMPSASAAIMRAIDVVAGIGWASRVTSLRLVAGLQTNKLGSAGVWAGVNADRDIGSGLTVTLTARRQDQHLSIRSPDVSLGLRVTRWPWQQSDAKPKPGSTATTDGTLPSSVVHVDATDDSVRLQVYVPAAHRVAVAGDMTDWHPVNMMWKHTGWWTISFRSTEGVSRIHMQRDDGAWEPVPGLPIAHDEYGGTVSLLLIPAKSSPTQ